MDRKFPKSERLHSRKSIKELFDKSSSFFLYPFKVVFFVRESVGTDQVLISVSKRKLRKATDRNWVKRRIREAYRHHKHLMKGNPDRHKHIGIIYVSSDLIPYDIVQKKIETILRKLSKL
ncbi:ribonuclease P protein component [Lunatimonas salinarum]|uniref:ribonuclease P protein component n=1 Tax=Lunatimonas salinarum TaxID=1774590 RepID=UPI001ADF607F|nr:ribonuclease P protein component [Lunatimonas salinarum]